MSVSSLTYLRNHVAKLHQIVCALFVSIAPALANHATRYLGLSSMQKPTMIVVFCVKKMWSLSLRQRAMSYVSHVTLSQHLLSMCRTSSFDAALHRTIAPHCNTVRRGGI